LKVACSSSSREHASVISIATLNRSKLLRLFIH